LNLGPAEPQHDAELRSDRLRKHSLNPTDTAARLRGNCRCSPGYWAPNEHLRDSERIHEGEIQGKARTGSQIDGLGEASMACTRVVLMRHRDE
jgi:hypothetical protein